MADGIGEFAAHGVRFKYPENWSLERDEAADGWSVTLQSPGTAFLMVALRTDADSADELAEATLAALREDYPKLEAEERVETLAGMPAVGHDVRFFQFDLTNFCWTRCVDSTAGPVLVMCQLSDADSAQTEPVLRAIVASLKMED